MPTRFFTRSAKAWWRRRDRQAGVVANECIDCQQSENWRKALREDLAWATGFPLGLEAVLVVHVRSLLVRSCAPNIGTSSMINVDPTEYIEFTGTSSLVECVLLVPYEPR